MTESSPLSDRFAGLARRLGATAPVADLYTALVGAWAEPHRTYHSTSHLLDCLRQLDEAPSGGAARDLAEAALWFHDAVYDPHSPANETRSAEWADRAMAAAGVPAPKIGEIRRLVLVTRHREPPSDPTGWLVADVDLSILGRTAAEYEEFEQRIRGEYAWMPEALYRAERAKVLRRLLERRPLYGLAHFHERYEAAARANLGSAIARLENG